MSEQKTETYPNPGPSAPARNPYIMNFCKTLVEKKGERHEPEDLKKLLGDMYSLFENLLGRNMVNALPEDVRKEYLRMADDLASLNYEKVGAVFDKNIKNYQQIMKDTMKQFAEIYMRNRQFNPEHYSVEQQPE